MFARVSKRITDILWQEHTISYEDRELYEYGLRQGLTALLNILTALAVGLVFGCASKTLLFMALYIPLRSFSGGHHARTPVVCYVQSVMMLTAVCLWIRLMPYGCYEIFLTALSAAVILLLAPVDTDNKPLDDRERKFYRKRALLILAAESGLYAVLGAAGAESFARTAGCVIGMMAVMLIIGRIEKK